MRQSVRMDFMKLASLLLTITWAITAQQKGPQPPAPPLVDCGAHGDLEIVCGTRSPEDLELTPDGKFLIVSQFVRGGAGAGGGLTLFDPGRKTFAKMEIAVEPLRDWG